VKTEKLKADSLFKERRIELAAESHFWFDLLRLYYYDPAKAKEFLKKQQRVPFTYVAGVATPDSPVGEMTDPSDGTFRFPLPASEVTANPKLAEPPVPYSFKD